MAQVKMNLIDTINSLEIEAPKKTTQAYGYMYAPLEEVKRVIDAAIKETDISYKQFYDFRDGTRLLVTTISMGDEMFSSVVPLLSYISRDRSGKETMNHIEDPQDFGGVSTYMRRYSLTTMFNLVSEDDDDCQPKDKGEQNNGQKTSNRTPHQPSGDAKQAKPNVRSAGNNVEQPKRGPVPTVVGPAVGTKTETLEEHLEKKVLVNHAQVIGLPQIKEIQDLATSIGVAHSKLTEFTEKQFGKNKLTELTLDEAKLIKERLGAKKETTTKQESTGVV